MKCHSMLKDDFIIENQSCLRESKVCVDCKIGRKPFSPRKQGAFWLIMFKDKVLLNCMLVKLVLV